MSKITNIIDALRRKGKPTEKSALARQDEQLEGREILDRRRERIQDPLGTSESFVAKVAPIEESIRPLLDPDLSSVRNNAALVRTFFDAFGIDAGPDWTLEHLESAFSAWLQSGDEHGYSDAAVIEILGAAFGEYCIRNLDLEWVVVNDASGSAVALRGTKRDVRAFPFHAVAKRIAAHEHGFFIPVYISIKHMLENPDYRPLT